MSVFPTADDISVPLMIALFPGLKQDRAEQFHAAFLKGSQLAEVTTPLRLAHWTSQLGHESGSLRWMEEIASGRMYEGRTDLGNVQAGDGERFKGRGPIQITGRGNAQALTKYCHEHDWVPDSVSFVDHPELLALEDYGFVGAAWYWKIYNLNELADADDGEMTEVVQKHPEAKNVKINRAASRIRRKINGGSNGSEDCQKRYVSACKTLGLIE